jgi:hypothetical protein
MTKDELRIDMGWVGPNSRNGLNLRLSQPFTVELYIIKNKNTIMKLGKLDCNVDTKLSYIHQIIFICNILGISCLVEVSKNLELVYYFLYVK